MTVYAFAFDPSYEVVEISNKDWEVLLDPFPEGGAARRILERFSNNGNTELKFDEIIAMGGKYPMAFVGEMNRVLLGITSYRLVITRDRYGYVIGRPREQAERAI